MTDTRTEIAEFIKLLRVTPGSEMTLARDFDPAFKADFLNKKASKKPHRQSLELLADYQERLAAQDAREKDVWERRYREINDWERHLTDNGINVELLLDDLDVPPGRLRLVVDGSPAAPRRSPARRAP